MKTDYSKMQVAKGATINLATISTQGEKLSKKKGKSLLNANLKEFKALQRVLYASGKQSVLIVFQAPDAAGKDGAIRSIFSGINPQGVRVDNFRKPSKLELAQDYLWRHSNKLPARGMIEIFNRSHYENLLVTRVNPHFLMGENIPGLDRPEDADANFWASRYRQINDFEQHIYENGTIIIKFFLHLSKAEQKARFLSRLDEQEKNWKFNSGDLKVRAQWDAYQKVYADMLSNTSTDFAPWHIIPADNKPSARVAIQQIIIDKLKSLQLKYPEGEGAEDLGIARKILDSE